MNIFKRLRAVLRLRKAVSLADNAHRKTGERYYVMPNGNRGKLIILDRCNFRILKRKGYIMNEAKVADLERECFYCTPYRNGDGKLPDRVVVKKRAEYCRWLGI